MKVFEKAHLIYTHRVQTEVVKTREGHIGLFPSTELQKDLHCSFCDFIASIASKLKRHMVKNNLKPAKVEEEFTKCYMKFMFKSVLIRHIINSHRE